MGSPPVCISIQLASLDLGPAQYQYELKPFKWTIQRTDYKWRKCRLETYKFLFCTVLATVLCHMSLKLPWGIYFLERVGVLLLSITCNNFESKNNFHDKSLFNKNIAHVKSTCCTEFTTVGDHHRGHLLSNF